MVSEKTLEKVSALKKWINNQGDQVNLQSLSNGLENLYLHLKKERENDYKLKSHISKINDIWTYLEEIIGLGTGEEQKKEAVNNKITELVSILNEIENME